jgi:tRNA(adenine34) deaminase
MKAMMEMKADDWMRMAIQEAEEAEKLDEVPIGAVIVKDNRLIAKAHNLKETEQMALAHAEMLAIQKAEKALGTWNLEGCDLYVTLEPCMMCTGAISLARINRLYYGTDDPKTGSVESQIKIKSLPFLGTYPKEIHEGLLHDECAGLLKEFFRKKRAAKKAGKQAKTKGL